MDPAAAMAAVHARFADAPPGLANGFAEHAPMGADALLALGLEPAAVVTWAARHHPEPWPEASSVRVTRDAIAAELTTEDWRTVLGRHAPRLLDRLDAHLFHGLIRTAHAVRALRRDDSPTARGELALGLAAWESWAGPPPEPAPAFSAHPRADILELARRGAGAFVAAPSIFTLHAVTAPMAYLLLAEHLDDDAHARAAGVFARTHARYPDLPRRPDERPEPAADRLQALLRQWDAHPAKLVDAALRGGRLTGDAAFGDAVATMMA